jgi:hypothetical protein
MYSLLAFSRFGDSWKWTVAGCALLTFSAQPARAEDLVPPTIVRIEKNADGTPVKPEKPDPVKLRKDYPFRSLKSRLDYERQRRSAAVKPQLTEAATVRLDQLEKAGAAPNIRAQSLQMLHSDQTEKFIKSPGFGVGRLVIMEPSPQFLPAYPTPELALTPRTESAHEAGPVVELPEEEFVEERPGAWSPSKRELLGFLDQSQDLFASSWNFGYVKSVDRVAGFAPHAFFHKPELHLPDPERDEKLAHRWEISRLELVSLLKQTEPRVYVSKNLPRMQDLDTKATRPLDKFETEALKNLRGGDDMQTLAELNTIRMVGALRASKQCMECHQVERGELLGAFSYELKRTPPLPVPKRRAI